VNGAPPLIPPEVRARLKGLRLVARRAHAAGGIGQHVSRNRGAGLEFAQYRAYEPGDEPRRIDWKLYARSDRYFVRESERDSALTVWVLLDATASMRQADAARPDYSKLAAARAIAACVAEVTLRQGDRFGLAAVSGSGVALLPPASGPRHRDAFLLALQRLEANGEWPAEGALRPLWERLDHGALLLSISDGFDEGLPRLLERLAATRREVLSIQVLSAEERDFPFRGGQLFREPETGAERRADPVAVRDEFLARFAAARRVLAARLAAAGIRHVEYVLDQPLDQPLQRFFAPRPAEAANA